LRKAATIPDQQGSGRLAPVVAFALVRADEAFRRIDKA
jgi:hypothetical protein